MTEWSGANLLTRHVASSRFEAARKIPLPAPGLLSESKFARLHGHGFLVSAFVNQPIHLVNVERTGEQAPRHWPSYRGGEVPELRAELQRHAARLDYQSLNDVLVEPSDINIATWFRDRLGIPGISGIALQSTPDQGVLTGGTDALVWRRYRFQAAHQLPHVPVGHKCGRLHGHGFEVVLHVISGTDPVDYDLLDRSWSQVSPQLSYRCLNDVAGLENPTSEMLAAWIWQRLKQQLPSLVAVSVYETASCGATYDGHTYRIWKDFTIDSATRYRQAALENFLARVHGYTYTLRLYLSAPLDRVMGWTVDFGDVKEIFTPVFKSLDHHPLHQNPELDAVSDGDTGSIATWLFLKSQQLLPELVRVDLFETEGCGSSVGMHLQGPELPLVRV